MKKPGIHPKHLTAFVLIAVFILEIRRGYFKGFLNYLRAITWKSYLPYLFIPAVLVIAFLWVDPVILAWIQAQTSPLAKFTGEIGGQMGRSGNCWTFLGWVYLAAHFLRQDHVRKIAFGMIFSSFLTALLVTLVKFTLLRARPIAEMGPFSFFNFHGLLEDAREFQSFPSGDVGVVAGAVAYLFYNLRFRWVGIIFFILPLMTAFARISVNKHWPSDTLFAIGLSLIGAKFVRDFKKHSAEPVP